MHSLPPTGVSKTGGDPGLAGARQQGGLAGRERLPSLAGSFVGTAVVYVQSEAGRQPTGLPTTAF